ncbi:FkbM family methyltransferase, partial [Humibacillus xanthopallidus]
LDPYPDIDAPVLPTPSIGMSRIQSTMATMRERARWARRRSKRYVNNFGLVRGLWFTFRDRPRATGEVELEWPGYAQPFRIRFGGSDLRTFIHVIAERGYEFPFDLQPKVIVDAGANVGFSAAYFATRYPAASIVAMEPDPGNFRLLCANTFGYARVLPIQAALWEHPGTVNLVDPGQGAWAFRVEGIESFSHSQRDGMNSVQAIDIPTLLTTFGLETIDLLKLDVEGAEREILSSAEPWIDKVSAIAVELHDRFQPGCTDAFEKATAAFTQRTTRGEDTFVALPF